MSGRLVPDTSAYHVPTAVRLVGRLDVEALRRSLDAMVHRHEALRICINSNGETQRVMSGLKLDIPVLDLSAIE